VGVKARSGDFEPAWVTTVKGVCVWGLATQGHASWTVKRESRRGPATRSQPGVRTMWVWAPGP